jgi:hypothetical protein
MSLTAPQSITHNRPITFKIILSPFKRSCIHFFIADSDKKHIRWVQSCLRHHLGLEFCLREVLEDPAVLEAVFLLGTLGKELDHEVVVDASTFGLHEFSEFVALNGVEVDILLDYLIHV